MVPDRSCLFLAFHIYEVVHRILESSDALDLCRLPIQITCVEPHSAAYGLVTANVHFHEISMHANKQWAAWYPVHSHRVRTAEQQWDAYLSPPFTTL